MPEELQQLSSGADARKNWREINRQRDWLLRHQSEIGSLLKAVAELRGKYREVGNPVSVLRLKRVEDDYLVCRSWDWTAEGDTDILVAKPYDLRVTGWAGQTVVYARESSLGGGTILVTYAKVTSTHRTATGNGNVEQQAVRPFWVPGKSIIYAVTAPSGISGVSLVDLNVDGRAYAKIA